MRAWLERGQGVGMVAVDPSSRRSGGALLGDRARLRLRADDRAFVRSMAARERLGGLAPATRAAALVLRAAFEWTLVETVGVGQSEIEVATVADCVVLVLQPDSGDALQFMKAGILEIPDLLVVHKWDLGAPARRTRDELLSMLRVLRGPGSAPPVLPASAERGEGVAELTQAIESCAADLARTSELARRRAAARASWALELLVERYGTRGLEALGGRERAEARIAETPGSALDAFSALDPGL
jgi:LAO/AO transport system kinase